MSSARRWLPEPPVLVTDVGDAALLVGNAGTVVPADDPFSLANAMAVLGNMSQSELAERGRIARTRIARQFTMTKVKDRYLMLYRSLLSDRMPH